MQGGHLHVTMNRALQRMAGTVLGACIVWAILAQITITPMALLMTHLAAPAVNGNLPRRAKLEARRETPTRHVACYAPGCGRLLTARY